MAPTLDASTPATVHATGTSGTSASFSPPASSLLSVMVAADGPVTSAETVTVTDSGGHTWTLKKRQNTNASGANAIGGTCEVWETYFPAAPGSITVTASWTPTTGANGGNIAPRVYNGANPDQSTAATNGTSNNGSNTINPTIALTPTQIDSIVVGAALDYTTNATLTPNGSTTDVDQFNDGVNGDTWAVWQSATPVTSLSSTTYGYTNAAAAYQLAAVEILPAPGGAPSTGVPAPLLLQLAAANQAMWFGNVSAGGTLFTQSLDGTIATSGALTNQANKALAGTVTSSGALTKLASKALSGSMTPTGALSKQVAKALSGTVDLSGALTKLVLKALAGSITLSGALSTIKVVLRSFAGTVAPAGALTKQAAKSLAGVATPSATVAKTVGKPFAATLVAVGGLAKLAVKPFAGVFTPSGLATLVKGVFGLAGVMSNTTVAPTVRPTTSGPAIGETSTAGRLGPASASAHLDNTTSGGDA